MYELTHIHSMEEFPGFMIKVFDDGELINHSDQPTLLTNTDSGYSGAPPANSVQEVVTTIREGHFTLIAARDIEAGEELTLDYNTDPEGPPYYDTLCQQYGVSWEWL
ncbi:MAG: SET domain-containing protein [bacterium]|nr:SET domain-containing protein [bacterium]